MPDPAHCDDYGGDCMTTPNSAHREQPGSRHNGSGRPLSSALARRSDGRWTQQARGVAPGPGLPGDPATRELAVTKARSIQTEADWAAAHDYDPAFEQASSRFFEADPGQRPFEHLMREDAGGDETPPDYEPTGVDHGFGYDASTGRRPGRIEAAADPGYPAGSGYEAVYGDSPIDPVTSDVDDDELVTGAAARRNAIEWAVVLVAAVLLALVLRALVLQAFYIPSPSMEDTLLIQDRVLVNKLSYRFGDVGRGDIVVFHRTDEEIATAGPNQPKDVIKRVIALGGETIEVRENKVFINDEELFEPYLDPGLVMPDFGPLTVPEDFLFVMGDNRNLSSDSRGELGPIAEERVVGRAFVLFWPVDRVRRL